MGHVITIWTITAAIGCAGMGAAIGWKLKHTQKGRIGGFILGALAGAALIAFTHHYMSSQCETNTNRLFEIDVCKNYQG